MRTGCHWNRLPRELGDDSAIHRTFQGWVSLGMLERIWAVLVEECEELGLERFYIHKSSPNENAVIERSFRTDEEEFFFWLEKAPRDHLELNAWYQRFLDTYNTIRPHMGINMLTPKEAINLYKSPERIRSPWLYFSHRVKCSAGQLEIQKTENMTTQRDYYEVLGASRNSSQEEIRTKFRRLALDYHPDRNKDPQAQEKFKEINAAYQVLSDPQKRAQYDRFGHAGVGAGNGGGRGFEGAENFGGFGDIFDAFFGGFGTRTRRAPQTGNDLQTNLTLSFEEAVFGVETDIDVSRVEVCSRCNGSAGEPGSTTVDCQHCKGTGQVRRVQRSIFGQFTQVGPCTQCNGEGRIITNPCTQCSGAGRERRRRKMKVDIPPGVEDGTQVRLTREGDAGSHGGLPGNLYIALQVQPHEVFKRRDYDILYDLPVNFAQAALGDEMEVPTLNGPESLHIPEGTQSGTVFRIKGKGVPYSRSKRGDHLVTVNVVTPKSLDENQRQLLQELAKTLSNGSREDKGWFGKIKDALGKDS